ncbi:ASCH domain-containing protein [Aestuariibius insulae]|uniref:ASCH domain-containing protein n=1 Tax=Aestuariibius insulae TaxID=2058287 RepID=UPI00345EC4CD
MTLEDLQKTYPGAVGFKFGDSRELNAELIGLVRSGVKTATCGAARDFNDDPDDMPLQGHCDVVLDWDGVPQLVVETVEVTRQRFCDVPEDFAVAEGEGTYDDWRRGHEAYFGRNGGFDPEMELICERFRVVEDLR